MYTNQGSEMEVYTVQQVADRLQITEHQTLRLIHAGELVAINISTGSRPRWRITEAHLEAFYLRRSTQPEVRAPQTPARDRDQVEYI